MRNEPIKDAWWVVPENGIFNIYSPSGEKVFGEIFCRVHDEVNELPKAIIKVVVNIASSKEDMYRIING